MESSERRVWRIPRGGVEVSWRDAAGMTATQLVRSQFFELGDGCVLITPLERAAEHEFGRAFDDDFTTGT